MPGVSLARSHEVDARTHERKEVAAHLPALDGLRGIAILAVVAFHAAVVASGRAPWAYESSPPWYSWPLFAGSLGVDVFFVLSGFLVLRSWRSIRSRSSPDGLKAVIEFARRRGRRLYPPYLFALAVLVIWRAPHWLSSFDGLSNILMFASLNQFLDTDLPRQLNTVTWSLTTETHFYVALPVLALVGARYGWGRMLAGLVAVAVGWRIVSGGTGSEAEWIIGRADQFAAGMFASMLVERYRSGAPSRLLRLLTARGAGWLLGGTLTTVALAHGALRLVPKPLVFLSTLHTVVGLAVAGLVVRRLCRGSRRSGVLANPALRWLGAISYSLYLWHWPLLSEAAGRWGPTAPVLAGAMSAALGLSFASYLVFERPFLGPGTSPADQPRPGRSTEATIAYSPSASSAASVALAPLGNRT